jgi:hypothetical protein
MSDDSDHIQNGSFFLSLSSRLGSTLVLFLYRAWLLCYPTLNIGHIYIKVAVDDHLLRQQSTWKKVLLVLCRWVDKHSSEKKIMKGRHSNFFTMFSEHALLDCFYFLFHNGVFDPEYMDKIHKEK